MARLTQASWFHPVPRLRFLPSSNVAALVALRSPAFVPIAELFGIAAEYQDLDLGEPAVNTSMKANENGGEQVLSE